MNRADTPVEKLSGRVISEVDLLKVLNIGKGTLSRLRREYGLMYIRLSAKTHLYRVDEVLNWLMKLPRGE